VPQRIVALGASNLVRGLPTVVAEARAAWGPSVEVLAALGHGRSYGGRSAFLGRALPGILECGIWQELERRPDVPTRALITDVGNDILYGRPPAQVLDWVSEAADRLLRFTPDIVLAGLPLASISRLSNAKYLAFRSLLFPRSRMPLARAQDAAERIAAGLPAIAAARGLRLQNLREEWYGFDPIHIRSSHWQGAWREILGNDGGPAAGPTRREWLRVYFMPPERRWRFGRELRTPQHGTALPAGGVVRLY
jgi:hypothetical protein